MSALPRSSGKLFDIRRVVYDIYGLIFLPEEDDEDGDSEEVEDDAPERPEELRRREDLTRRLEARIEELKVSLAARRDQPRRESS